MQRNLLKYLKVSTGKIRKCQEEAVGKFLNLRKEIFVTRHA